MYTLTINWLKVLNSKYHGDVHKSLILNTVAFWYPEFWYLKYTAYICWNDYKKK